jgi:hypothetical protein
MRNTSIAALAFATVLSAGAIMNEASAMPMNGISAAATAVSDTAKEVRYVCGPYRCWWRPGGYWVGRPYAYRWGYHRWGWHRWGWHRWG